MIGTDRTANKVYIIDAKEVKSQYDEQDYTMIIAEFDKFVAEH
jgi:hypothetical protein